MNELTITAGSTAEAARIARELQAFGAVVEDGVVVRVREDASIPAMLSALDMCLARNRIAVVTVNVNGKRYVMEPGLVSTSTVPQPVS